MLEYLISAVSVWIIGFFPWAEIYVAVPAGIGLGLDLYSVIFWSVFGNYLPAVLIAKSFDRIKLIPGIGTRLQRFASPRAKAQIEKNGTWATLVLTPWLGVWAMAVTVKMFGMKTGTFLWASFVSILLYAVALAALIHLGIDVFT
jgi:hypothetical protein